MTVLVVDDDAVVVSSCVRILESEGYDVLRASGAAAALAILEGAHVDLLLTDVIMPERDGVSLAARVKERWSDVPILLMSGFPAGETVARGARVGASHFVAKPFTPEELAMAVRRVLAPRGE